MAATKTLQHLTAPFAIILTKDMTQSGILAEIKAAGYTLGAKSLAALMSGEKPQAGDFKIVKGGKAHAETHAGQEAADAAKAGKAAADAANVPAAPVAPAPAAPAPVTAPVVAKKGGQAKTLTPEQAKLAADAEKANPAPVVKQPRGKDWSTILPQSPVAVRKDSVMHKLFMRLCDPAGATKEQLMEQFGWSAGGLAGIIHWEPKAKGYLMVGEKAADGKLHYHLAQIGNPTRRYTPAEIIFKEKAVPAPKAPKAAAPAAAAPATPAAPAPAKKVRVTKEQMAQVPAVPMGGVSVTKRVSAKKSA